MTAYDKRNQILKALGFSSYSDYLDSRLWKKIRKQVFRKSKLCVACLRKANQVHHKKYTKDNLSGQSVSHLVPICMDCHQSIEFSEDGTKLTLNQANCKLSKLVLPAIPKIKKGKATKQKKKKRQRNTGDITCRQCGNIFFRHVTSKALGSLCESCCTIQQQPKKQRRNSILKLRKRTNCDTCGRTIPAYSTFRTRCKSCRESFRNAKAPASKPKIGNGVTAWSDAGRNPPINFRAKESLPLAAKP